MSKGYLCPGMYDNKAKYSKRIKDEALRLGFMQCGIAKAEFLEEEAPRLESWLNNNHHGQMAIWKITLTNA